MVVLPYLGRVNECVRMREKKRKKERYINVL